MISLGVSTSQSQSVAVALYGYILPRPKHSSSGSMCALLWWHLNLCQDIRDATRKRRGRLARLTSQVIHFSHDHIIDHILEIVRVASYRSSCGWSGAYLRTWTDWRSLSAQPLCSHAYYLAYYLANAASVLKQKLQQHSKCQLYQQFPDSKLLRICNTIIFEVCKNKVLITAFSSNLNNLSQ